MGRSLYRPAPENTPPGSFYHQASDRYYTMIERGGKFYQRRHQIGFGGKETNVLEVEAGYVVGSGNHARTYLHRTSEGSLVELPVSWYAEKGGYWAMSPGYDRSDQQEFRRAIPDECKFCHLAASGTVWPWFGRCCSIFSTVGAPTAIACNRGIIGDTALAGLQALGRCVRGRLVGSFRSRPSRFDSCSVNVCTEFAALWPLQREDHDDILREAVRLGRRTVRRGGRIVAVDA